VADFNTLFIEQNFPFLAFPSTNATGAAETGSYVSFQDYKSCFVIISTAGWAGGTAAVTLQQATTLSAGTNKALNFTVDGYSTSATATQAWLWTNNTTTGAITGAAITSNTFNLSAANTNYMFEVFANSLDINNGYTCFQVKVASPGSNADYYQILYLMRLPAYEQSGTFLPTPYSA
jgi:hypothetical protein